ncbi:MAG: ABC transporter permease [Lacunisphaera sp.]|nr:ABC transporter permease [Lacunisphaera sp.]
MRIILTLLQKDFARLVRDKAALSLTFIVPFALIYLFGQVFGVNRTDTGPSGIPLAVVNESDNPAAAKLLAALQGEKAFFVVTKFVNPDKSMRPLTETDLRPMMKANNFRFALVIPRDLIRDDEFGLHLKILSNPRNEIETQTVHGILQKTIFANVPQLLGQSLQARAKKTLGSPKLAAFNSSIAGTVAKTFGGDPAAIQRDLERGDFGLGDADDGTPAPAGGQRGADFFAQLVKIDNEQVIGRDVKAPAATHIVGGWAMQFLLFAVSASAAALFHEKEHGLFQRLLSAPATRAHILWSKFLYGVLLGLVQLVVLFAAGRILYGIDVEHHLPFLMLVCVFAAAACTAFGMLLAAVSPSPEAARGLATFCILIMSAVGGAWFPVSFMPEFIQRISKLTLVYWSMEGFDQVLWANASFIELLPTLGILGGITAAVMAVAVWRFNRGPLFD